MVCEDVADMCSEHVKLGFRNRERIILGFEQNDVNCVHLHMYVVSGLVADSSCSHTINKSDRAWGTVKQHKVCQRDGLHSMLTGEVLATNAVKDALGGFPTARIFLVKLVLDVGSYILVVLVFVHGFQTNLNSAFFITAGHVTLNDLYRVRLQQVCSRQRLFPLFLLLNISHRLPRQN